MILVADRILPNFDTCAGEDFGVSVHLLVKWACFVPADDQRDTNICCRKARYGGPFSHLRLRQLNFGLEEASRDRRQIIEAADEQCRACERAVCASCGPRAKR
jgi:hypothetical protein